MDSLLYHTVVDVGYSKILASTSPPPACEWGCSMINGSALFRVFRVFRGPLSALGVVVKITDVKAVYPRWRYVPTGVWQSHFWQIVVRVQSDAGAVGLGYGGGGGPGGSVVNEHLRELLVGRRIDSVDDIREAWDHLYFKSLPYGRKGIPVMALSGVDNALWDIFGKSMDRPVYRLLGGTTKEKVPVYLTASRMEAGLELGIEHFKPPSATVSPKWRGPEPRPVSWTGCRPGLSCMS